MTRAATGVQSFWRDDTAATMVEYGLMLTLIALVCVAIVASVGTKTNGVFANAVLQGAL